MNLPVPSIIGYNGLLPASIAASQSARSTTAGSSDFFQIPGDNTLITSSALCLIPPNLAATAVPVSVVVQPQVGDAGPGPVANATHRPRYPLVQVESAREPVYEDISDDSDESDDDEDGESIFTDSDDPHRASEEQSYREHTKAVRHYMGWEVPDIEPSAKPSTNPLWSVKSPITGRISVKFPMDSFLVDSMRKLNLTITAGYPTKANDSSGLPWGKLLRNPNFGPWYDVWSPTQESPQAQGESGSAVVTWVIQPSDAGKQAHNSTQLTSPGPGPT